MIRIAHMICLTALATVLAPLVVPQAAEVNPDRPNVLLLGDSISIGYTRPVRKLLSGQANVFRAMKPGGKKVDNCGDTRVGLQKLDAWLGSNQWDVIHFNWGLWDLCYRNPEAKTSGRRDKVNGTLSVPLEDYERNLGQLVTRLEATGAKLIWASTTVVPDGEMGRFAGDEIKYNTVAARVMQRHGIPMDDLFALTKSFDAKLTAGPGNVHYNGAGYQRIAEQVAREIRSRLPSTESYGLEFEYMGVAVQQVGKHVWGSSPVIGPDGKVHLYVAQWPKDTQADFSGWFKDCEIAHYVGDTPAGPFAFVRVAVPDQDGRFNSPHNPTIKFIDDRYVLCFIVNEDNNLKTQRIIMYVAEDLSDTWRPAAGAEADGTILRKSTKPTDWNVTAKLGVSNPSLIKHKGNYLLYDKSVVKKTPEGKKHIYVYGVAVSDRLEGPYHHHPKRVTPGSMELEDAYAFSTGDEVILISRDFVGSKGSSGGGLLWRSKDGFYFDAANTTRAYEDLAHYLGKDALRDASKFRGSLDGHLERPQVLFLDNQPAYLYVATGINTTPGCGSGSHVFRINRK